MAGKRARAAVKRTRARALLPFTSSAHLSFGENCLTDNVLERHGLKLLTTPYSHGRTTIEHILELERDDYRSLLDRERLERGEADGHPVVRLGGFGPLANRYDPQHELGFEFTHHQVLDDPGDAERLRRRAEALVALRGRRRVVLWYHHRQHGSTDRELLAAHLTELRARYSTPSIRSEVVCFTQELVDPDDDRRLTATSVDGVPFYVLHTRARWEGADQDVFWARVDDDLIAAMVRAVKAR